MGVKRAVDLVFYAAKKSEKQLYTLGQLIHNPQTVELLDEKNIAAEKDIDNIPDDSEVVLRSHGVAPQITDELKTKCYKIWDATCPKVAMVQNLVNSYTQKGYQVIIIGDRDHSEVQALVGFSNNSAIVINSEEEVAQLGDFKDVCVVGQTTLNKQEFEALAQLISDKYPQVVVKDTLCDTTKDRQNELMRLASEYDSLVIVGGYNSSNTKHLYEIAIATGKLSIWVERASELTERDFEGCNTVLVTAGASTPHWVITDVVERLNTFNERSLFLWERNWVKDIGYTIIQSNLYKGGAAAALTFTTFTVLQTKIISITILLSFLYVISMHTLYHFIDWQGIALLDPKRLSFYRDSKWFLYSIIFVGILGSLFVGVAKNVLLFSMILFAILGGIIFTLDVPAKLLNKFSGTLKKFTFIKSKDVINSIGLIWFAAIIPVIWVEYSWSIKLVISILLVSIMAFIRSILFSLDEHETDSILQRASIPLIVGKRRTVVILNTLLFSYCAVLLVAVITHTFGLYTLLMILPTVYYFGYLIFYERGRIIRTTYAELWIDGGLYLMGLLSLFSL